MEVVTFDHPRDVQYIISEEDKVYCTQYIEESVRSFRKSVIAVGILSLLFIFSRPIAIINALCMLALFIACIVCPVCTACYFNVKNKRCVKFTALYIGKEAKKVRTHNSHYTKYKVNCQDSTTGYSYNIMCSRELYESLTYAGQEFKCHAFIK